MVHRVPQDHKQISVQNHSQARALQADAINKWNENMQNQIENNNLYNVCVSFQEMKMNEPHEPIPKGGEHRDELVDLIDRMLSIDPDARPTAREICEIPWLASSCFEGSATFLRDVKSISLPPKEKSRNESSSSHVRKPTGQTKPSRLKRHQSCNR